MKQPFFYILLLVSVCFFSCKKNNPLAENNNSINNIRYEFTADVVAAYRISTLTGNTGFEETISASSWSKTITPAPKTAAVEMASIIVFAPDAWMNTQNQANVTLKIFVGEILKGTKSFVLFYVDRPSGNELKISY